MHSGRQYGHHPAAVLRRLVLDQRAHRGEFQEFGARYESLVPSVMLRWSGVSPLPLSEFVLVTLDCNALLLDILQAISTR